MTILKADAFAELPKLKTNSVDIVITDPPYDLTRGQIRTLHGEFMRISKTGAIVFAPPENQWVLPADQFCFWIKPTSTKNTTKKYSRFVEMMFLYGDLKWNTDRHWSQYTNIFQDLVDTTQPHAYRKPPSLIERLILNHTDPWDIVLDPFAGSGTINDVATKLGRRCISYDIERGG